MRPFTDCTRNKHSINWERLRDPETVEGFCRTTITPMHYESVPGSGDYDTPIDMTLHKSGETLYMDQAAFHFEMHPDGWYFWGGRQGAHWVGFRLVSIGTMDGEHYRPRSGIHYDSRPEVTPKRRNLCPHPDAPDEWITVLSVIERRDISALALGGEVSSRWELKGNRMKEDITIAQGAREALTADSPVIALRFDLDWTEVSAVVSNDDGEPVQLVNEHGELIAQFWDDVAYVVGAGGTRPVVKSLHSDEHGQYLLLTVDTEGMLDGDLVIDPQMTQEQISASTDDCTCITYYSDIYPNYYYYAPNFTYTAVSIGGVLGYGYPEVWHTGLRFTPNVPNGATFTRRQEYASITTYVDSDNLGTSYPQYPSYPPIEEQMTILYGDVASANQPTWAANFVDSPGPTASNFTDSTAFTRWKPPPVRSNEDNGRRLKDIDVSPIVEEIAGLGGWAANQGMRFRWQSDRSAGPDSNYPQNYLGLESYRGVAAKAAILDAFYSATAYTRTKRHQNPELFHKNISVVAHNDETLDHKDETLQHNE